MEKMTIIEIEQFGGVKVEYVLVDKGNGEFTSTPKSIYDEQQAEQSTPSVTSGD
jgi:hypothetical protein